MSSRDDGARALLLTGEPGVGKSALLQEAVRGARARGALIFRSTGVQTESSIELSALHQLVQPLMRAVRAPSDWLRTLERTFTPAGRAAASAFEISNAVIGILDVVAGPSGVLLVVDDVQWIDHASASMLAFIARRIDNRLVSVLLAVRSAVESPLTRAGLPVLAVHPLSPADSARLLQRTAGALDETTAQQILVESAGNPLALVELPKALSAQQRRIGDESSSDNWTLTVRLESVFAERFSALSENSRWLLLLCALDRTDRVETIKRASGNDWWFPDLAAANDAGVLELDGDRVAFRHPLARSAVVQASSRTAQRSGHARLAGALKADTDSWAWHRAEAADGPDGEAADALVAIARRAFQSGDFRSTLRAMLRAIDLTPDGATRERRAARAAFLANVTGQIDVARRILPRRPRGHLIAPVDGELDETEGYIAATTAFWLMTERVDVDTASTVLLRALRGARNIEDRWVLELFDLLVLLCLRSGRADLWEGLNAALDDLGARVPEALAMTRDALGDPVRTAHGFAARTSAFRERAAGMEPWQLMWLAACSVYVDDLPVWRGEIRRVIDEEEVGGSLGSYLTALVLSSLDGLASGEWRSAVEQAEHGLRTAERLAFRANVGDFRSVLAVIAARRGDYETARDHIRELQRWALPLGLQDHRAWALFSEAQIELAQQNYDEAYGLLAAISPAGAFAPYQPVALMAFMDTVVSAWRSGRRAEALKHVDAARAAHLETISPRSAFHLAACEALVADRGVSAKLFEEVLARAGIAQWPFDEARVRLVFGSCLREEGEEAGARFQLRAAIRTFDRLGAQPWRERAQEELMKASDQADPVVTSALALLTPQETRIAVLASEGRSNNDIAAALFLSPRTVASHLYRIFPKLEVTSRAGLHQRLNPSTAPSGRGRP